mgnify:CR=1 FL=1
MAFDGTNIWTANNSATSVTRINPSTGAATDPGPPPANISDVREAAGDEGSVTAKAKVSEAAGADVVISSHPFNDDAWNRAKLVADGKAGAVSPWVTSKAGVQGYYASTIETAFAIEAADRLKTAKP